jgi:hypothetical protein
MKEAWQSEGSNAAIITDDRVQHEYELYRIKYGNETELITKVKLEERAIQKCVGEGKRSKGFLMNIETITQEAWDIIQHGKDKKLVAKQSFKIYWMDEKGKIKNKLLKFNDQKEVEVKENWIGLGKKKIFIEDPKKILGNNAKERDTFTKVYCIR